MGRIVDNVLGDIVALNLKRLVLGGGVPISTMGHISEREKCTEDE
jgi:hypothetical protein